MDDAELIREAKAGDERALTLLVERHLSAVYAFCVRYIGNTHDAEDAVQEAFLKVWRNIKKFDTKKPFRPWLFQIAKNAATDLLRKRKTVPFSDLDARDSDASFADTLPDLEKLPDELFAHKSLGEEVARALLTLSARDRLILTLRYEQEFSFEEIATITKVPANTVRSLHRRALAALRAQLAHT